MRVWDNDGVGARLRYLRHQNASARFDIALHDHLIAGNGQVFSFHRAGML
jgi:hypothetical protein